MPTIAELPMQAIGWMLDSFFQGLAIFSQYSPSIDWRVTTPWMMLFFGAVALGMLFLSIRKAWHPILQLFFVSLLLLSGVLLHQYRKPPAFNHFRFTLLDVGQGLSAVVRTANHSLIFDTGPKFPSGFNTGSSVILPYLINQGISGVNRLILSHSDIDHVGGAVDVLEGTVVEDIQVGEPPGLGKPVGTQFCRAGSIWWWDGVRFEILHPPAGLHEEGNNQSCVLRVSAGGDSVLITGDVELPAEGRLLSEVPEKLPSTIVVAAHHGSNSSSSEAFVRASHPQYVLFSAGKNNRWNFPGEEVVERWQKEGAMWMNTADSGAIEFDLGSGKKPDPSTWMSESRRYWHK
jgi:competence protein ComEC